MQKPVILTVDDDPEVLRAIERDLKRHYEERVPSAASGFRESGSGSFVAACCSGMTLWR